MTNVTTEKVTIAVAGKFHAFHLASEYALNGKLEALYASHRTLSAPKNLTAPQYKNRPDLAIRLFLSKYPVVGINVEKRGELFDTWMVKKLINQPPGILHGWNGSSIKTFKALSNTGWLRCVERSCPYNLFQYELLKAEAENLGLAYHQDMQALERAVEELYLADVIVAPSTYSANSYADPELVKKVRLNPLGANVQYQERSEKTPGLKILMVGNAFLRKGTHYLIEAFKLIDQEDSELWIRGDVPEEYLARIKDNRIKIIPPILPDKLAALYRTADVFVQPSIDEGFGMTVFEALAYGLPLVVTEHVGAKDLLNSDLALTVPIRDPEALATAIKQAIQLPSEKFDQARKHLLNQVSWKNTTQRMFDTVYVRN